MRLSLAFAAFTIAIALAPPAFAQGQSGSGRAACFAQLDQYADEGTSPEERGDLFLERLKKCDESLATAVENGVVHQMTERQAQIFAHQKSYVFMAYGVIWGLLVAAALAMFFRQRKLQGAITKLQARFEKERS